MPELPGDLVVVNDAVYEALRDKSVEPGPDGQPRAVEPAEPTVEQLIGVLTDALQAEMDEKARTLGYDDIKTAITYRGDPNPKFASESEALFLWRSAVWTQAYALLDQVQQGLAQFPTVQEAIDMMPPLQIDVSG